MQKEDDKQQGQYARLGRSRLYISRKVGSHQACSSIIRDNHWTAQPPPIFLIANHIRSRSPFMRELIGALNFIGRSRLVMLRTHSRDTRRRREEARRKEVHYETLPKREMWILELRTCLLKTPTSSSKMIALGVSPTMTQMRCMYMSMRTEKCLSLPPTSVSCHSTNHFHYNIQERARARTCQVSYASCAGFQHRTL